MQDSKKVVWGVIILAGFTFIVSVTTLYVETSIQDSMVCGCPVPVWLFIPLLSSIGVVVGTAVYYMMSERIAKTRKNARQEIEKTVSLLPREEAEILKLLIRQGKVSQSSLPSKISCSRVKVHRAVKKLEEKGAVAKESRGKTNSLTLSPEFKKLFE
jgi:DNA-binding MarR family transcriptional regulator